MRTRFAPTPSGYLHRGNAINALIVWRYAKEQGLDVALRIDDLDADRYRPECVDDIFRVLTALGLEWRMGPRSRDDLEATWSQRYRMDSYEQALRRLMSIPHLTYVCRCSRQDMAAWRGSGCPSGCDSAQIPLEAERSLVRMRTMAGDVVVWRRDGLPSYHLASVVDDELLAVTHIVRGEDLREVESIHARIAIALEAPHVTGARYVYHPLVTALSGEKLSKSRHAPGISDRELDDLRSRFESGASTGELMTAMLS